MAPKWEIKRSLTFFSFLLPWLKYLGWAAEPLELHRNNTNRAPKKGGVSHMVPSALSNLNFPRAHPIPCMLCSQGVKFLISVLSIYGRQNIRSHQISSTDQKKLADCMTCSFPTTSHFKVLLSTPKTTEIILTAPDFWNNVSGDFPIFNSLQRFPEAT